MRALAMLFSLGADGLKLPSSEMALRLGVAAAVGCAVGFGVRSLMERAAAARLPAYSVADQPARFALARAKGNSRVLDISSHFDASSLRGKRVLVTGATRGLGLALAQELAECGAIVYATCRGSKASAELSAVKGVKLGKALSDGTVVGTGGPRFICTAHATC